MNGNEGANADSIPKVVDIIHVLKKLIFLPTLSLSNPHTSDPSRVPTNTADAKKLTWNVETDFQSASKLGIRKDIKINSIVAARYLRNHVNAAIVANECGD
jgi:hypothetical protein